MRRKENTDGFMITGAQGRKEGKEERERERGQSKKKKKKKSGRSQRRCGSRLLSLPAMENIRPIKKKKVTRLSIFRVIQYPYLLISIYSV